MTATPIPAADLSDAYNNGDHIPDAASFVPRWTAEAAAFRAALGARARLGQRYGPAPRETYDLFLPEGAPKGLLIFIHGGYWLAFGPSDWSHFATGALARGWAVAMPGYTLAPEARISQMTAQIARAYAALAAVLPEVPIVATGHSAGGHLSARLGNIGLAPSEAARLKRVVPISPLADLRPLLQTSMNVRLKLDPTEAAAESPALLPLRDGLDAAVWVGAEERPAFLWQARLLSEHWRCRWTPETGLHHFNVIDGLMRADSPLVETLLGGISGANA